MGKLKSYKNRNLIYVVEPVKGFRSITPEQYMSVKKKKSNILSNKNVHESSKQFYKMSE